MSLNDWKATFEPGERRYIETTLDNYKRRMRLLTPAANRVPIEARSMRFSLSFFTAVGTSVGDVRYLICVERVR